MSENAWSICSLLETSADTVKTLVLSPTSLWIDTTAFARTSGRRPMIAILEAPARAKDCEIARPIPKPPPVMTTVLPERDSSGRDGEMLGYEALCQVLVADGNEAIIRRVSAVGTWGSKVGDKWNDKIILTAGQMKHYLY